MKITYLILSYRFPNQLQRLINSLQSENCFFLVHIDKKIDNLGDFSVLFKSKNVKLLSPRLNCHWGHISLVEAILKLIQEAPIGGYYILLSDQHYPLVSQFKLHSFLNQMNQDAFIGDANSLDKTDFNERILDYTFFIDPASRKYKTIPPVKSMRFFQFKTFGKIHKVFSGHDLNYLRILLSKRTPPIKMHFGCAWWAMNSLLAKELLEWLDKNPSYLSFHKYSLIPDEMFFHSILNEIFKIKITSKSLTYVNWQNGTPKVFSDENRYELKLASQNFFFARKFDYSISHDLVDFIDNQLIK